MCAQRRLRSARGSAQSDQSSQGTAGTEASSRADTAGTEASSRADTQSDLSHRGARLQCRGKCCVPAYMSNLSRGGHKIH